MNKPDSISEWLAGLKDGSSVAEAALWDRFFDQICAMAKRKLGPSGKTIRDEEDLALSAMNALMQGAQDGRFHRLENRDDAWQLLHMILARKISNHRRYMRVRRETAEADLAATPHETSPGFLDQFQAVVTSEKDLDSLGIECEELLALLEPKLQHVALLKLSGYSNAETAEQLGKSIPTIERYLRMIRLAWESFIVDGDGS